MFMSFILVVLPLPSPLFLISNGAQTQPLLTASQQARVA